MYIFFYAIIIFFLMIVAFLIQDSKKRPVIILIGGTFNFIYAIYIFFLVNSSPFPSYLFFDSIGKIIFLSYSTLVFSLSIYAYDYLKIRSDRGNKFFIISMLFNMIASQLACMAQDFGILWVALESSTLSIAPLIYFNRTKFSIEATWKFILLTSTGIAIALLGTYMLGFTALNTNGHGTLNILELKNIVPIMDKKWLLFSIIFMIIGYSSKVGFAPFHWWKPDAYGEAPGVIGGLSSGGLVGVSMISFFRIYQLLSVSEVLENVQKFMLILGFLSLIFSTIFIISQKNIKRLLAYSSVEHVGIIAIGLGIGKMAIMGSLLHVVFNTIAKGVLFLSAGDIERIFRTKQISDIKGILSISPIMGIIFIAGLIASAGSPPFSLFISEFYIMMYGFMYDYVFAMILMIFLLGLIFMGIMNMGIDIVYGKKKDELINFEIFIPTRKMFLAEIFLLTILLIGLFYIPDYFMNVIKDALLLLNV